MLEIKAALKKLYFFKDKSENMEKYMFLFIISKLVFVCVISGRATKLKILHTNRSHHVKHLFFDLPTLSVNF